MTTTSAPLDRLTDVGGERDALGVAGEQRFEAGLVDRDLSALQRFDAMREDVANDDLMAEIGEAGSCDESDVARAENGDLLR